MLSSIQDAGVGRGRKREGSVELDTFPPSEHTKQKGFLVLKPKNRCFCKALILIGKMVLLHRGGIKAVRTNKRGCKYV